MSDENLWGDLPVAEELETPFAILRAQANALRKLTGGVLDARIVTSQTPSAELEHEFRIVAPALGSYSTEILSIRHSAQLYPVRVSAPDFGWGGTDSIDSAELKANLKTVLQGDRARKIVAGLVAQSRDIGAGRKEEEEAPV